MDTHPHDDQTANAKLRPNLPNVVATDAEFRAAVKKGQASARAGCLVTLDQVEAKLYQISHASG